MTAQARVGAASNTRFPRRRVGEKLDVLHALAQLVENSYSAIEQRATILGRLDTLALAVEQAHAERVLQVGNRFRNVGLGGVQLLRRLPHAAGLHDCHKDVHVLQPDPSADAVTHLHDFIPYGNTYNPIK